MKLIFAICAIVATLFINVNAQQPDISIYTTSKCEDTIDFIKDQLFAVYREFKDYLNIEFIPWGKSERKPNGYVSCQFGPKDCFANKIQSCALHYLAGKQDSQVSYMYCEMTRLASIKRDYTCVRRSGLNDALVRNCAEGPLGNELERMAEYKTSQIVMEFVPTIVLNHSYDPKVQKAAYSNFRKFVCGLLKNPR